MEHMAEEVRKCLVQEENRLFVDEDELNSFLSLYEEGQVLLCSSKYSPQNLSFIWHIDREYEGNYLTDYNTINNSLLTDRRTA